MKQHTVCDSGVWVKVHSGSYEGWVNEKFLSKNRPNHENLSEVEKRKLVDVKIDHNRKHGKVDDLINHGTFSVEGTIFGKTELEGTGAFWSFSLKSDNGDIYNNFTCTNRNEYYFRVDQADINEGGYSKLGVMYKRVRLYFPNSEYNDVINRKNREGDGIVCPSIIVMETQS